MQHQFESYIHRIENLFSIFEYGIVKVHADKPVILSAPHTPVNHPGSLILMRPFSPPSEFKTSPETGFDFNESDKYVLTENLPDDRMVLPTFSISILDVN
jgi:hypothetical protein